MIEPFQNYTLTVTHPEHGEFSITIHGDCDIEELKQVFITIMTWMTFAPETISKLFIEEE